MLFQKKIVFVLMGTLIAASALAPLSSFAQTTATMPPLYNAAGVQVNAGPGPLAAGYYYLQPGVKGSQVYYYGNGMFYNPSTGLYGGSVNNPNGTAGVSLYSGTSSATPGVPNTGAGGDAMVTWLAIAISGAVLVSGAYYIIMMARRTRIG